MASDIVQLLSLTEKSVFDKPPHFAHCMRASLCGWLMPGIIRIACRYVSRNSFLSRGLGTWKYKECMWIKEHEHF